MKLHATDKVVEADVRPARPDGTCFYCTAPLGEDHRPDCIVKSRSVVLKVEVEFVADFPRDWDSDMIEFARNESSWCADNIFADLAEAKTPGGCTCGNTTISYVREATEADHASLPSIISDRATAPETT